MTIGGNLAQNWNGSFTFAGSKPLNLGSGTVALGATPTITVNASTLTAGGNISGSFGLTLAGAGTLNLAGANTYSGDTTIGQGVLQVGSGGAIPTGASAGNVVFSNPASAAVFDLNGNSTVINGLSQPSASTTNLVVNNLPGSTATLTVGNGGVSSTYGGVLANNTGTGGVLALTKGGAGMLTLINNNTYTGPTTLSGGSLQLGTGVAGQDGFIGNSSAILMSNAPATLAINNVGPTTLPAINGPVSTALTLAVNSANTVTLTGLNNVAALQLNNNATLTGGTIALTESATDLVVNATGTTTLATPVVMNAPAATIDWSGNSSGTLAIAAPITVNTVSNLFLTSGNYSMNSAGSLTFTVSGAVVMNSIASSTTNFLQTGGLISLNRPANNTLYLTQAGTTTYMMTGGSLIVATGTTVLADGTSGRIGTMTINGAGVLVSSPAINYDGVPGAVGTLNLQNGLLQADSINTSVSSAADLADCVFNFSGGTLQPIDNGTLAALAWGSATATQNTSITLSASETMSSSDATGVGRTVKVYSPLNGSGVLTLAGNGTLVFSGTNNSNYNGEFLINSGTVQTGSATGLPSTSGTVQVSGGKLDLNGFSPSTGAVNLASGSIVNSGAAATLTATSFTLEGGTSSASLGGATTPLTMAGPGVAVLSGSRLVWRRNYHQRRHVAVGRPRRLGQLGGFSHDQRRRAQPERQQRCRRRHYRTRRLRHFALRGHPHVGARGACHLFWTDRRLDLRHSQRLECRANPCRKPQLYGRYECDGRHFVDHGRRRVFKQSQGRRFRRSGARRFPARRRPEPDWRNAFRRPIVIARRRRQRQRQPQ